MVRCGSLYSLVAALFLLSPFSWADGFGINATRLIYPENENSISVTLRNTTESIPYLVQTSVSSEQNRLVPAPFIVTPPLFRLEPQSINQVRIAFKGADLPQDRESVFYFNATGIPASSSPKAGQQRRDVQAMAQFGVGNIIKIFYRPKGFSITSTEAQKSLKFARVSRGIEVENTSPYFINLASLSVNGHQISLNSLEDKMIAPFSRHVYSSAIKKGNVSWQAINDFGGVDAHNSKF